MVNISGIRNLNMTITKISDSSTIQKVLRETYRIKNDYFSFSFIFEITEESDLETFFRRLFRKC